MAGLHKYFHRVTLPTSDQSGLGEAVTKEVNHAVERILKEQNEVPNRKRLKDHLRRSFQTWTSEQVSKQLQEGKEPEDVKVDTRLTVMKPL